MSLVLPTWVMQNPDKYCKRMNQEIALIQESYTLAKFFLDSNIVPGQHWLYLETPLLTRSINQYRVRIYYPPTYPYDCPIPLVLDHDVIEYCTNEYDGKHRFHNYGVHPLIHGLYLCVMNPSDNGTIGQGWQPKSMSIKTILDRVALWLHAYEVRRTDPSKKWILPE